MHAALVVDNTHAAAPEDPLQHMLDGLLDALVKTDDLRRLEIGPAFVIRQQQPSPARIVWAQLDYFELMISPPTARALAVRIAGCEAYALVFERPDQLGRRLTQAADEADLLFLPAN